MTTQRKPLKSPSFPSLFDQARDELFSHILRCGVLEADQEHQKEWLDDTMQYLAERYPELSEGDLEKVRLLGDRFCQPVVARGQEVAASKAD